MDYATLAQLNIKEYCMSEMYNNQYLVTSIT